MLCPCMAYFYIRTSSKRISCHSFATLFYDVYFYIVNRQYYYIIKTKCYYIINRQYYDIVNEYYDCIIIRQIITLSTDNLSQNMNRKGQSESLRISFKNPILNENIL